MFAKSNNRVYIECEISKCSKLKSLRFMEPKKLSLEEMEEIEGGWCLRSSHLVCGGLGLIYGIVSPWLGFGVAAFCGATWYDFEDTDPGIIGNSC
jgi:hypothetical protein